MSNRENYDEKFFKAAKHKTVLEVDYNDIDELINRHYNRNTRDFSLVSDQELSNDSTWSMTVEKEELDSYDLEKIEEFRETGRGQYLAHALLTDLANKEIIPEGNYAVSICW